MSRKTEKKVNENSPKFCIKIWAYDTKQEISIQNRGVVIEWNLLRRLSKNCRFCNCEICVSKSWLRSRRQLAALRMRRTPCGCNLCLTVANAVWHLRDRHVALLLAMTNLVAFSFTVMCIAHMDCEPVRLWQSQAESLMFYLKISKFETLRLPQPQAASQWHNYTLYLLNES